MALSQNARNERDLERRMQDMRALDSYSRRQSEKDRREFNAFNPPELDKKTKERIRQMRMFDSRDVERYTAFRGTLGASPLRTAPSTPALCGTRCA